MTIATTQTFNLEVVDLIEEAYERAGLKMETGYDFRTGKRSIDLLMLEWQNRNIDIWMVEERYWRSDYTAGSGLEYQPTVGQTDYVLELGTVDVLDVIVRTGTTLDNEKYTAGWTDTRLSRIPERSYAALPSKLTTGTPSSYYVKTPEILNESTAVGASTGAQQATIVLYPAPEAVAYNILYWRTKRIADAGTGANTVEVPGQFLPALVSGLAYKVCMKHGEVGGRLPSLKADYDEQIMLLGKSASVNDEGQTTVPIQQTPAPQQYPMARGRDGQVRIARSSGRRRM